MKALYESKLHGLYHLPGKYNHVPRRYDLMTRLFTSLSAAAPESVLEIGPESPLVSSYVARKLSIGHERYHAVDISDATVKELSAAGFNSVALDVSAQDIPIGTRSIDLVIMSEVLEHLTDPDHALREIGRVLRSNGILIITTPNLASWFNRVALVLGLQPVFTETGTEWTFGRGPLFPPSRPVGHLRILTYSALIETVRYHGYTVKAAVGLPIPEYIPIPGTIRTLDRGVSRLPALAAEVLLAVTRRSQGSTSPGRSEL